MSPAPAQHFKKTNSKQGCLLLAASLMGILSACVSPGTQSQTVSTSRTVPEPRFQHPITSYNISHFRGEVFGIALGDSIDSHQGFVLSRADGESNHEVFRHVDPPDPFTGLVAYVHDGQINSLVLLAQKRSFHEARRIFWMLHEQVDQFFPEALTQFEVEFLLYQVIAAPNETAFLRDYTTTPLINYGVRAWHPTFRELTLSAAYANGVPTTAMILKNHDFESVRRIRAEAQRESMQIR